MIEEELREDNVADGQIQILFPEPVHHRTAVAAAVSVPRLTFFAI